MKIEYSLSRTAITLIFFLLSAGSIPGDSLKTPLSESAFEELVKDAPSGTPLSHHLNLNENDGYQHAVHMQRSLREKIVPKTNGDVLIGHKHNL